MFQINNTLVSESIIENDFVCNLSACKGACCVEGDAGAPLEPKEIDTIRDNFPSIKKYLNKKSLAEIDKQGLFVEKENGELETPIINGKECVYLSFDNQNFGHCSFEKAYNDDLISWKKPISCHLYPVRTKDFSEFTSVNYDKWSICSDACKLGKELKVPVYKFVKEALIRKFGEKWYFELEQIASNLKK
ncbi:MAG: DUF3109 family protein [Flavobacteriaceae bacterium]|nr:DUF3109 family protein [Flavobacteriaceae bacterium]